jgi:hypothetical protein
MLALADDTQSAADEKTLGFSGREFKPWMAKFDSRLVQ